MIVEALDRRGTEAVKERALRVCSSFGTVGYRSMGRDGMAFAVYHCTGDRQGAVATCRRLIGGFVRRNWFGLEPLLGFPLRDEYLIDTGARSDFEGGKIEWVRRTREIEVYSGVADGGERVLVHKERE